MGFTVIIPQSSRSQAFLEKGHSHLASSFYSFVVVQEMSGGAESSGAGANHTHIYHRTSWHGFKRVGSSDVISSVTKSKQSFLSLHIRGDSEKKSKTGFSFVMKLNYEQQFEL